jgi:hypothetical protein
MSALPPKTDIAKHCWDICFVPIADIGRYSTTSSARVTRMGGTVSPIAAAASPFGPSMLIVGPLAARELDPDVLIANWNYTRKPGTSMRTPR